MDLYRLLRPLAFRLDAEKAHHLTLIGMKRAEQIGLLKRFFPTPEAGDPVRVMGLRFPNRVGLAAGMDKSAMAVDAFGTLGFGHVEVGTITPRPQPGNEAPRLFRLKEHDAIINRMGFNNPGLEGMIYNLGDRETFDGVLGVNIGKNFDTPNENANEDYLKGLRGAWTAADYIAVNLSSPNTKGLRDLQNIDSCESLIRALHEERTKLEDQHGVRRPIAVKFAPDLSDEHLQGLAEMCNRLHMDAVIATNTTLSREAVKGHPLAEEAGGLSGAPLTQRSLECLEMWRKHLDDEIPVISVGGIMKGDHARQRIEAGAALVQVYTGLVYRGPKLVEEILEATR